MRPGVRELVLLLTVSLVMGKSKDSVARQEDLASFAIRKLAEMCTTSTCLCSNLAAWSLETCARCSTQSLDCSDDTELLLQAWNESIDALDLSSIVFAVPEPAPSPTIVSPLLSLTLTNVDASYEPTPTSAFVSMAEEHSDEDDIPSIAENDADGCLLELNEVAYPSPPAMWLDPKTIPIDPLPSRGPGRVVLPAPVPTLDTDVIPVRAPPLTDIVPSDEAHPIRSPDSPSPQGTTHAQHMTVPKDQQLEEEAAVDSDVTHTLTPLRLTPTPTSVMVVLSTLASSGFTSTVVTTITQTLPAVPEFGGMKPIAGSRGERPLAEATPEENTTTSQRRITSPGTSMSGATFVPTDGAEVELDDSDASNEGYTVSRVSTSISVAAVLSLVLLHAFS
ncbi:hypothetical protein CC1G_05673 [Coprinopsis cinerea okayama7|uniref:Uncharacterized protein n=1 Tax=Coprinopsis cinerea (strain Okayama-7 / 130 / ATCC MYA-4618 / FGSC 9003) TaxID=240176 RepID=A8N9U6_COPC7|nr:hypothetical protein CC1G_05673 [Coprinopsis cinerea okayama7\|eukprot:XP_001831602.2 hypothetical protein CC1G_05673 [Coprinopsis cinerea okayama7\